MAGFKDMVAADRTAVFLDVDFFGELAHVEGKQIPVVMDSDELKERKGGQDLAVADSTLLFHAKAEDLPPRRAPGSGLNFNRREYIVDAWEENMSIVTVILRETVST